MRQFRRYCQALGGLDPSRKETRNLYRSPSSTSAGNGSWSAPEGGEARLGTKKVQGFRVKGSEAVLETSKDTLAARWVVNCARCIAIGWQNKYCLLFALSSRFSGIGRKYLART